MASIQIAIVSDLHVGKHARASDLAPVGTDGLFNEKNYLDRFVKYFTMQRVRADYLLVPGDVTDSCQLAEVEIAAKCVARIAKTLHVPKKNVIFVPGNHDVDWDVLSLGTTPVRAAQRYDNLKFREHLFCKLLSACKGNILKTPFLNFRQYDNLVVVGFNSSWHDRQDELMHYGRIEDEHLVALESLLRSIDLGPHRLRLFILHHHPIAYSNPAPGEADFSMLVNSEALLKLLAKYQFDLIIHGHTHQPRFSTHEVDVGPALGILSAGTFSMALPSTWNGKVTNQFHVITVDSRDPATKAIRGNVTSWCFYHGTDWIPSNMPHAGIPHVEPFGGYTQTPGLVAGIRPILITLFNARTWVDWKMIVGADGSLAYARPMRILEALDILAAELNFRIHERAQNDLSRIVLLKEVH